MQPRYPLRHFVGDELHHSTSKTSVLSKVVFCIVMLYHTIAGNVAAQTVKHNTLDIHERCGTVHFEKARDRKFIEHKEDFEQWMQKKTHDMRRGIGSRNGRLKAALTIPVVVHIIHNGTEMGKGSNLSDEQIISQIDVLNEDFRRTNSDASNTPSIFQSVASDTEINFVLARQDPEGLPTNGITRTLGTKKVWDARDDFEFKQLSFWPSEDYLNIWVVPLRDKLLGYAKFPTYALPGLDDTEDNRLVDGVVIDDNVFGSSAKGDFPDIDTRYNLGRTATHEVGHFLGLRHIWGDDEGGFDPCVGTDYCDDTPNVTVSTDNCPTGDRQSCGSSDMYQNYMDYTYDACMNLFTKDQKDRMRVVLENAPRRLSLTTSLGTIPPSPLPNDLGVKRIANPLPASCGSSIIPELSLRNYGTNTVTSTRVALYIDGILEETKDFGLNLAPLDIGNVRFSSVDISPSQAYEFRYEILKVNDVDDSKPNNNSISVTTKIAPSVSTFPSIETFEGDFLDTWEIRNFDKSITWTKVNAPQTTASNSALSIKFFDYSAQGERDMLVSPVFDFSGLPTVALAFDIAYAPYLGNNGLIEDELQVIVSTDCGNTFEKADLIFDKVGQELSSLDVPVNFSFAPVDATQWQRVNVNLFPYRGLSTVRIAFVGVNNFGNNLYLDNIRITDQINDVGLTQIVSPSPVICASTFSPKIEVENRGSKDIHYFEAFYSTDGSLNYKKLIFDGPQDSIKVGERKVFLLDEVTYSEDEDLESDLLFDVFLDLPNNLEDEDAGNNSLSQSFTINKDSDFVPYLESFQTFSRLKQSAWTTYNPDGDITWELTDVGNKRKAVFLNSFAYASEGEQDWLISPVLDLSEAKEALLAFDVSYAIRDENSLESLRLLVSKDCGLSFQPTSYSKGGDLLRVREESDSWVPDGNGDWLTESFPLDEYLGNDAVRLAFVATNNSGNNLYLDQIEVYIDDNPIIINEDDDIRISKNPITDGVINFNFNLRSRQDLTVRLLDVTGKELKREILPNVLNQSDMSFVIPRPGAGTYLVHIVGPLVNTSRRIITLN